MMMKCAKVESTSISLYSEERRSSQCKKLERGAFP